MGHRAGHGTVESYTAIKAFLPFTAHFSHSRQGSMKDIDNEPDHS
jgi:hypothetical protein